jgi:hypothetical protein
MIFGTPSELVEMFDETHVLLFFIVLLFVGISGLILNRFTALCAEMDGKLPSMAAMVVSLQLLIIPQFWGHNRGLQLEVDG